MDRQLTRSDIALGVACGNLVAALVLAVAFFGLLIAISSGLATAFIEGVVEGMNRGSSSAPSIQTSPSAAGELEALTRKLERDLAEIDSPPPPLARRAVAPAEPRLSTTCEAVGVVDDEVRVRGVLRNEGFEPVRQVTIDLELLDAAGGVVSSKQHRMSTNVAPGKLQAWGSWVPLPSDRSDERVECRVSPFSE